MPIILVTGGAGFIGSHLCEKLLAEGLEVVCIDNFNDYYDPELKEDNIKTCLQDPKFILVRSDIRNKNTLSEIFDRYEIEQVVHLAARAGVIPSIKDPIATFENNIIGTQNILDLCRTNQILNLTLASSSSVYGDRQSGPFRESDSISTPVSPYAASKVMNEAMAYAYHVSFNLNICCMRFFTVYGPRQRPDMAIHHFIKQVVEKKKLSVYGSPKTSRDYTFIDDIVDGVRRCMSLEEGFHIFNLGYGSPVYLGDLVDTILKVTDIDAEVEWLPGRVGDVPITHSDGTKAKKELGFAPKTSIENGISKFFEWYKENFTA